VFLLLRIAWVAADLRRYASTGVDRQEVGDALEAAVALDGAPDVGALDGQVADVDRVAAAAVFDDFVAAAIRRRTQWWPSFLVVRISAAPSTFPGEWDHG
jgi:hypothetical protein